ncbi:MAG: SPFH/Band 7/PHB domain protein [Ruminococcaceae bacterium]|nr:SPFH/Band 7/PHB domain protein [Oscillospiraceae bacterium]MBQ2780727.1 SPFH/Band 7/PHB domain protein [Clostridia bacterium]MBQ7302774.1 SPFH/Band 7/PHB domain protein [Clostridia bacterium]
MENYYYYIGGGVVLFILLLCIRVVPQANEYVVERLGKYLKTWGAGLHFLVPLIDRTANKVTLKEQVLDSPPQPVITKDNVTMQIDTVVYFKVFDAKLFTYGAVNPISALSNLTATTLRNIVGELELDDTLTSRDTINGKMTEILDSATDQWGIKVNRVELKNIIPPAEIQNAMEKQMKAERDRRETLLEAEGHKAAVITRAEGDKQALILAAEGERDARIARAEGEAKATLLAKKAEADGLAALKAAGVDSAVLELKKYEALIAMANGTASKIIVPTDAVDMTKANVMFSETTGLGDVTPAAPKAVKTKKGDPCCD